MPLLRICTARRSEWRSERQRGNGVVSGSRAGVPRESDQLLYPERRRRISVPTVNIARPSAIFVRLPRETGYV
jgi:hypothetical protein